MYHDQQSPESHPLTKVHRLRLSPTSHHRLDPTIAWLPQYHQSAPQLLLRSRVAPSSLPLLYNLLVSQQVQLVVDDLRDLA